MKRVSVKFATGFLIVLINICFSQQALSEPIEHFSSQGNIDNNAPFSHAVRVGDLLFLSGELGTLPNSSKLVEGGIRSETKQTMDNIKASLAKHGLSMEDLVKCTVMLANIKDWPTFNKVYKPYFPTQFPT